MSISQVTIGADPEVFFVTTRTNLPYSSEGLLGGDKNSPKQMEGLPPGYLIQEDNVTAEFNIPPAKTCQEFTKSIFEGLKYVTKVAKSNNLKLAIVPTLDFTKEQLMTKHCQTLGCNPDFNAWTEEDNPPPVAPETMRTAAGHIHIGWKSPNWQQVILMVKMFDLYVTVPSILVTEPNRRRELYGKAGACRPKPYGVECRAVDNFWLKKQSYQKRIYQNTMLLISEMNQQMGVCSDMIDDYSEVIISTINNHDQGMAQYLCDRFQIPLFN